MNKKLIKDPAGWHFQHKWLQDEKFVEYIEKQIDEFFEINTTQTTACIKWEAFKAFIKGHIIQVQNLGRFEKRECNWNIK